MTQEQKPPAGAESTKVAKEMTAADAAKRVKRPVVTRKKVGQDDDGKPVYKEVTELVDVKAKEVLSFKDYGTHVVVVTEDGKKFTDAQE